MQTEGTLLLRCNQVEELLTLRDCIDAVEEVFRLQGQGKIPPSGILGVKAPNGGLHVKAGFLPCGKNYIVAKFNTNFPNNRARFSLPTIQGLIAVYDAHKQEVDPALIASAKVIADSIEQCCAIGDTHHAIAKGLIRKEDVYAELGEIVAGRKSGRTNDDETFIFDSTGVAIEDAVAAA